MRRARVHTQRYFRWHQDDHGGIRGEFFSDEIAWARVAPGLEAEAKARWKAAGAAAGDSLEAHRMDALIDILSGTAAGTGAPAGAAPAGPAGARPKSRPWSSSTPQPCAGARPKVTSCVRSRASGRSRSSPPPSSSAKAACATWSKRASTSRR